MCRSAFDVPGVLLDVLDVVEPRPAPAVITSEPFGAVHGLPVVHELGENLEGIEVRPEFFALLPPVIRQFRQIKSMRSLSVP